MPFKPTSLPSQIAAARTQANRSINAPITSFSGGAAQKAKESSARWTKANIQNPQIDSAAPWFSGGQPFSELRYHNQPNFEDWKGRFANETDMGWKFAPPPPEPAPTSAPGADAPPADEEA